MANTYSKLRNGDWGVKVGGPAAAGQVVSVTKQSGEVKQETIERVLWTDGRASLCSVRRSQAPARQTPIARQRGGSWTPCGYPGCSPGYCDECDGEGRKIEYRRGR